MLTAFRSQCLRGIRKNSLKINKSDLDCPLMCDDKNPQKDTQNHLITCKKLSNEEEINISQIYGSVDEQLKVSKHCVRIMKKTRKYWKRLKSIINCLLWTWFPAAAAVGENCTFSIVEDTNIYIENNDYYCVITTLFLP